MPELLTPEQAQARVRAVFGNETTVKSPSIDSPEDSDEDTVDLLTRVCYFYPQYTLEEAEKLTNSEVTALLIQAEKQRAIDYYNHVLIAAAPHSKKGKLVEKLIKQYKAVAQI